MFSIPFPAAFLLSFALVVLSVRALGRAWRARQRLFAEPVDARTLGLLVELALFVLVPVSVLLHEVGHMVAVWLSGGRVIGFGYLLFLGWVEYTGVTDPRVRFWIALSGNLVSVLFGGAAILAGLFAPVRRPLAALLLVTGGIVLVTSLVFYPLLDFATGLHGDWTQLYGSGLPEAVVLGVVHGALLGAAAVLWRSRWLRWRVSERIGLPWRLDEAERRYQMWRQLADAAERLRAAEPVLTVVVEERDGMPHLALRWRRPDGSRGVLARVGERASVVEVVALAGDPLTPRATWRAVVPDEALFLRPSPLVELLERFRAAADALRPTEGV